MPTISEFFGIVVFMNLNDHIPPHFHARYGGYQATFLLNGELYKGEFPPTAKKLIKEWAVLHENTLEITWKKAMNHEELPWIEPLK